MGCLGRSSRSGIEGVEGFEEDFAVGLVEGVWGDHFVYVKPF